MRIILFLFLLYSCNNKLLFDCSSENYFISPSENIENTFLNKKREIYTTLSKDEMNSLFSETNMSCKDVLSKFFYCNICFNNDNSFLISYNGTKYNLDNANEANKFTDNVISLIREMDLGYKEYNNFLNTRKTDFLKKEQ